MKIYLHRNFERKYAKLRSIEKERFKERRDIFLKNPYNPILNNHALAGKYQGNRSIDIKGDLRTVFSILAEDEVLFVDIDTHSNLYG